MAISYTQELHYACPECGAARACVAWVLIDTQERPELRQALLDGQLNMSACTSCQTPSAPDGPLLLHEGATQQVYFAVPGSMDEHVWREYAQELLHVLVQALPEDQRLPYLGDVQIEQGLDGVRGALTRRSRRANRRQSQGASSASAPVAAQVLSAPRHGPAPELVEAIEALLACDSTAELEEMVRLRPVLREASAVAFIATMIDSAEKQADNAIAHALRHARSVLLGVQQGRTVAARSVLEPEPEDDSFVDAAQVGHAVLPAPAYQALIQADSPEALHDAVRDYPQLLEPWAGHALAQHLETALEVGHEHLAAVIEERSATLADLRSEWTNEAHMRIALKALAGAKTEETLLQAINAYPVLLTEATQQALAALYERILSRGEEQRAMLIDARRSMLNTVRQGMEIL